MAAHRVRSKLTGSVYEISTLDIKSKLQNEVEEAVKDVALMRDNHVAPRVYLTRGTATLLLLNLPQHQKEGERAAADGSNPHGRSAYAPRV
jgi:hypothetical protein